MTLKLKKETLRVLGEKDGKVVMGGNKSMGEICPCSQEDFRCETKDCPKPNFPTIGCPFSQGACPPKP